jgi:uncharacterized membrane protein
VLEGLSGHSRWHCYFLGLFTEYEWGSQVSLIVFLALYFLFLWVSWVLAVRVTKPKTAEQQSS